MSMMDWNVGLEFWTSRKFVVFFYFGVYNVEYGIVFVF